MKKLVTIAIILTLSAPKLWASAYSDTLKRQVSIISDSLKGPINSQIAAGYMRYDTVKSKKKRAEYEDKAIDYTLQAIRAYSKYNDTTGLRISFDNLAKVYHAQKKYSQAKWFILQSNTLSRAKNDVPNIITSLLELASIKTDIKDYDLASRDLNEALQLSVNNHYAKDESAVQESYAVFYTRTKDPVKAAAALKRHMTIDDSIRRAAEDSLIAKAKTNDSLQNQSKKKLYTNSKKLSKSSSSRKTASL
jgi:tetratricopeptide (TPR) repeat protein